MDRQWITTSLLLLLSLCSSSPAVSNDDIELRLDRGPGPDETTLEWVGVAAPYQVFRGLEPQVLVAEINLLETVGDPLLIDTESVEPGQVVYYEVGGGRFAFTDVPICPTPTSARTVRGAVELAAGNCENFEVAAYIRVPDGVPGSGAWWTKPNFQSAIVPVLADCSFAFDSYTGEIDNLATEMAAYLVPKLPECSGSCQDPDCPPCAAGTCARPNLPSAVAMTQAARNCPSQPVLRFADREWAVKASTSPIGPGPNVFCSGPERVWVDQEGLHLTVSPQSGTTQWCSTEVILTESLGYGQYCVQTRQMALSSEWTTAGLFTWDGCAAAPYRELDFEYARWGDAFDPCNSQTVVQPCSSCTGCGDDCAGRCNRIEITDADDDLSHALRWESGRATFEIYRGRYCGLTPPASALLKKWSYVGADVPVPGAENFHLNLWLFEGHVPGDSRSESVVLTDFYFKAIGAAAVE